jgi:hypothetical protein
MAGSIPVGKDKDGNPIMINPFALNPLGSGIQFAQQMAGSWKAIHHPETFNKYQDPTLLDSLNPVLGSAVGHMSGATSKPFMSDIEKQMAPVNLINQLRHPGSGSIYPTTRQEALGHYIFGALYPRKASQETITATLQRELRSNPIDLYNLQASQYQKATGEAVPPELAVKVKGDLDAMQHIKDFQKHYASTKGSTGFRSLPATDQLTAAIQYLEEHHKMAPADIEDFKKAAVTPGVDEATMKKLANAAWGATGAGVYKRKWEEIYGRTVKTKLRPSRG